MTLRFRGPTAIYRYGRSRQLEWHPALTTFDHRGATTAFPGPGTNRVDVADGRGDDRVVLAYGPTNHIVADRGDQDAHSAG